MTSLKNVLLINALSSGVTGIGMIAFSNVLANLFGVSVNAPFVGVGIFLFLFAAFVLFVCRLSPNHVSLVRVIILLDVSWVFASLIIVAMQLFALTTIGYALIAAVALWVATMAYLQYHGLRAVMASR